MKDRRKRNFIIGTLCTLLICMGIAYALLTSTLKITGVGNVTGQWDIEMTSIESSITGKARNIVDPTVKDLTATFQAGFTEPGDEIVYTITVENKGTINAKLSSTDITDPGNNDITFTNDLELNTELKAGDSMTFHVTIAFNSESTSIATGTEETYKIKLIYQQVKTESSSSGSTSGGSSSGTKVIAEGKLGEDSEVYWKYYSTGRLVISGEGTMSATKDESSVIVDNNELDNFNLVSQIVGRTLIQVDGKKYTYEKLFNSGGSYYSLRTPYTFGQFCLMSSEFLDVTYGTMEIPDEYKESLGIEKIDKSNINTIYILMMESEGETFTDDDKEEINNMCSKIPTITSIEFESGNTITNISRGVFENLGYYGTIEIPSTVTEIQDYAFEYNGLTSVTIPSSVVKIGDRSFGETPLLTSVSLNSEFTSLDAAAFKYSSLERSGINVNNSTINGTALTSDYFTLKTFTFG